MFMTHSDIWGRGGWDPPARKLYEVLMLGGEREIDSQRQTKADRGRERSHGHISARQELSVAVLINARVDEFGGLSSSGGSEGPGEMVA